MNWECCGSGVFRSIGGDTLDKGGNMVRWNWVNNQEQGKLSFGLTIDKLTCVEHHRIHTQTIKFIRTVTEERRQDGTGIGKSVCARPRQP